MHQIQTRGDARCAPAAPSSSIFAATRGGNSDWARRLAQSRLRHDIIAPRASRPIRAASASVAGVAMQSCLLAAATYTETAASGDFEHARRRLWSREVIAGHGARDRVAASRSVAPSGRGDDTPQGGVDPDSAPTAAAKARYLRASTFSRKAPASVRASISSDTALQSPAYSSSARRPRAMARSPTCAPSDAYLQAKRASAVRAEGHARAQAAARWNITAADVALRRRCGATPPCAPGRCASSSSKRHSASSGWPRCPRCAPRAQV